MKVPNNRLLVLGIVANTISTTIKLVTCIMLDIVLATIPNNLANGY